METEVVWYSIHRFFKVLAGPSGTPLTSEGYERFLLADVIVGRDIESGTICVFFGRERLEQLSAASTPTAALNVLGVEYDYNSTELEAICATCEALKGDCNYRPSPGPDPLPNRVVRETMWEYMGEAQ
jgi:hypothetical protein